MHYQHIMTLSQQRRPSHPPAYPDDADLTVMEGQGNGNGAESGGKVDDKDSAPAKGSSWLDRIRSRGKELRMAKLSQGLDDQGHTSPDELLGGGPEELPTYSSSIAIEGVFHKKHEIENTTKRAEDRQWHTVFVALNGTALSIYNTKKDWGWGKARDGPSICPDNPPWIRKAKLEKTYSLLHADAGIAADYKK